MKFIFKKIILLFFLLVNAENITFCKKNPENEHPSNTKSQLAETAETIVNITANTILGATTSFLITFAICTAFNGSSTNCKSLTTESAAAGALAAAQDTLFNPEANPYLAGSIASIPFVAAAPFEKGKASAKKTQDSQIETQQTQQQPNSEEFFTPLKLKPAEKRSSRPPLTPEKPLPSPLPYPEPISKIKENELQEQKLIAILNSDWQQRNSQNELQILLHQLTTPKLNLASLETNEPPQTPTPFHMTPPEQPLTCLQILLESNPKRATTTVSQPKPPICNQ